MKRIIIILCSMLFVVTSIFSIDSNLATALETQMVSYYDFGVNEKPLFNGDFEFYAPNDNHTNPHSVLFAMSAASDLTAESIIGPDCAMIDYLTNYTVRVRNIGDNTVSHLDYSVKLLEGNNILATVPGRILSPGNYYDFVLPLISSKDGRLTLKGFIDYALDTDQRNNYTTNRGVNVVDYNVTYVGSGYINMPNHFFELQAAIDNTPHGGTIYVSSTAPGEKDFSYETTLMNKDISIIGSTDKTNPSIVGGYFNIINVTENTKLENLLFYFYEQGMNYTPREFIVLLSNANPTLNNLDFMAESQYHPSSQIIIEMYNSPDNQFLIQEISNSTFHYGSGITIAGSLSNVSARIVNCNFKSGGVNFTGNYLTIDKSILTTSKIVANYATISNSTIYSYSYSSNDHLHASRSALNISSISEVNIYNNTFLLNASPLHNNFSRSISIHTRNNINIERNIFKSTGSLSHYNVYPYYRVKIAINEDNALPCSITPQARIINNTEVTESGFPEHRFLFHKTNVIVKNSIITGSIYSETLVNNTSKFAYNWFVKPTILPEDYTEYMNEDGGENQIDPITLTPIWTSTFKSFLIEGGDPDTNDNGTLWYTDETDRDPDGTGRDIGAVHYPQSIFRYNLNQNGSETVIIGGGTITPNNRNDYIYDWVSFPFLDKFTEEDVPPNAIIGYVLGEHNDNNLFGANHNSNHDYLERIVWNFGQEEEISRYQGLWQNLDTELDSRLGYKIKMNNNGHRNFLLTTGFRFGKKGNNKEPLAITLPHSGEYWLGYFNPPEYPLIALREIEEHLTEIKTRSWSMNRDEDGKWITTSRQVQFRLGEAVSVTFVSDSAKTFRWRYQGDDLIDPEIGEPIDDEDIIRQTIPLPVHFVDFEEQLDYIPVYVELPEEMVGNDDAELAIFINDVCYGAEVVFGNIVQINVYIHDINFAENIVEFRYYRYGPRSTEKRVTDFQIYNQNTKTYQTNGLDIKNKSSFYQISLLNENESSEPTLPLKTTLEGNYPNPFNPTTTIRFNLAAKENVKLTIYNIRGQLVKTLINEEKEAGEHSIIWNGNDDRLNNVASGIYFYKFETSAGTEVKKMLLMK